MAPPGQPGTSLPRWGLIKSLDGPGVVLIPRHVPAIVATKVRVYDAAWQPKYRSVVGGLPIHQWCTQCSRGCRCHRGRGFNGLQRHPGFRYHFGPPRSSRSLLRCEYGALRLHDGHWHSAVTSVVIGLPWRDAVALFFGFSDSQYCGMQFRVGAIDEVARLLSAWRLMWPRTHGHGFRHHVGPVGELTSLCSRSPGTGMWPLVVHSHGGAGFLTA